MLGGLRRSQTDDVGLFGSPPHMAEPMADVVQDHRTDRQRDKPHVENGHEPCPAGFCACRALVNGRASKDCGDAWVALSASVAQIVRMDR